MRRTPPARIWRATFAVVGWAALALQYLLMIGPNAPGDIAGLTLNFFSYFTILTNVLAALALTTPLIRPDSRLGRWSASEGVRAAIALYITVVGLTYHLLLSQVWSPQGLAWLANGLLHYVMPVAVVLDWLLFTPRGRLRWIDPVKWLAFPLAYVGWTLVHGYASGWWPYWFLDVPELGWTRAGFWAGVMLALFLGVGLGLVGLDRAFGRGARDSGPTPA